MFIFCATISSDLGEEETNDTWPEEMECCRFDIIMIIMIIIIMINDHDNDSNHSNHCNYDSNYYENCENVSFPRSKMVGGVNYGLVLSFHVNNDHLK